SVVMALVYADRVMNTSTTAGTGNMTVAGAVLGWRSCGAARTVGQQFYYTIVDPITGDWETGEGTYSATNTLQRDVVRASTNGGALVNFAANAKNVFLD